MIKRIVAIAVFACMVGVVAFPAYAAGQNQIDWVTDLISSVPSQGTSVGYGRSGEVTWDDLCKAASGLVTPSDFPAPAEDSPVTWQQFEDALNQSGLYCVPFSDSGQMMNWNVVAHSYVTAGQHAAVFRIADDMLMQLVTFFDYFPVDPDTIVTIDGPAYISPGETIQIRVPVVGAGLAADVSVTGLDVVATSYKLCTPTFLLLVRFQVQEVIYTCRVTAHAGDAVSFVLTNVRASEGAGDDIRLRNAQWVGHVRDQGGIDSSGMPQLNANSGLRIESTTDGQMLLGFTVGTTASHACVSDIVAAFTVPTGASVEVTNGQGSGCDPSSPVATGQKVTLASSGGQLMELTVVVRGDVLGSGIMSISQLVRLAQAVTGIKPLTGAYYFAGDVTGDGSLNVADLTTEAKLLGTGQGEQPDTSPNPLEQVSIDTMATTALIVNYMRSFPQRELMANQAEYLAHGLADTLETMICNDAVHITSISDWVMPIDSSKIAPPLWRIMESCYKRGDYVYIPEKEFVDLCRLLFGNELKIDFPKLVAEINNRGYGVTHRNKELVVEISPFGGCENVRYADQVPYPHVNSPLYLFGVINEQGDSIEVNYIRLSVRPDSVSGLGFIITKVEQAGVDVFAAGINWPTLAYGPALV